MTIAISVLTAALLSFHLATFPGWFDAAELSLALQTLGVSHPSGHPLYVNAGKLLTLLPVGSVAYRTSLFSLLCVAGALGLFFAVLLRAFRGGSTFLAVAATTFLFLHPSLGLQATRTEVYAFQFLCSVAILAAAIPSEGPTRLRRLLTAGFLLGLALCTHPLLSVSLLPPLFFSAWAVKGARIRTLSILITFILLGMIPILHLPLRASADAALNWGDPSELGRFLKSLFATDYRSVFHSPLGAAGRSDWIEGNLWVLLPWPLLALSFLGPLALWRRSETLSAGYWLIALLSSLVGWLSKDFHLVNPDSHAYVLLPIALALFSATLGAFWGLSAISIRPSLASAAACLAVGLPLASLLPMGPSSWKADGSEEAESLAGHLYHAPPRSLLETGSDHWVFPLWYRSLVEGVRPDVALPGTGLLRASWHLRRLDAVHGGSWMNRPAWREVPLRGDDEPAGFLFSSRAVKVPEQRRFETICRGRFDGDPFRTRASVCANVVMASVSAPLTGRAAARGIAALEQFLDLPPSGLPDGPFNEVSLPYPLASRNPSRFLPHPDSPLVTLLLSYLGRRRGDLAERVWNDPRYSRSVDVRLIRARFLSIAGDETAKEGLNEQADDSPADRGYLALARGTFAWRNGDAGRASREIRTARRLLGSFPAIDTIESALNQGAK